MYNPQLQNLISQIPAQLPPADLLPTALNVQSELCKADGVKKIYHLRDKILKMAGERNW